jgi:hypothetical protein
MQKTLKNKRFKRVLCINVLYISDVCKNAPNLKIERQKTNRERFKSDRHKKATNLLS